MYSDSQNLLFEIPLSIRDKFPPYINHVRDLSFHDIETERGRPMGRYSRCALKVEGRKKSCAIVLKFLPPLYYEFFFLLTRGRERFLDSLPRN